MINSLKVAIVDDEPDVVEVIGSTFNLIGADVLPITDPLQAIEAFEEFMPNLIVLDKVMPKMSGDQITRVLRGHSSLSQVPIIMLTAIDAEDDLLDAFRAGVDDYVTKPFSPPELLARARAVTMRAPRERRPEIRRFPQYDLEIDVLGFRVQIKDNEVALTPTEFNLFLALVDNAGTAMTRDSLHALVLGKNHVSDQAVDVHIASLRKKLRDAGDIIATVRGIGYRFS